VVARVGNRVGIGVTPHMLRRTCGFSLLNNGCSLLTVSKILGHANVQITQAAYAELLDSVMLGEFLEATG
jgi:integrase/recombinase XerD